MPRGSPFTQLCRQFAGLQGPRGADLHVHTTASDGSFTPSQAVALAKQVKLAAIAITDHDTLEGLAEARRTAAEMPLPSVEVVSGVEITTTFEGRELHLLGYFVQEDDQELLSLLRRTCDLRRIRFRGFVDRLASEGVEVPAHALESVERGSASLGRRHLAGLMVRAGHARNHHTAWQTFVGPISKGGPAVAWPTIVDAIGAILKAGGVPSLAHPPEFLEDAAYASLRDAGLIGIEVVYPWSRTAQGSRLRAIATRYEFLTTGGSDCHGATTAHRAIGSHTITAEELERLRARAAR